jgi:hypothetical protein
MSLIISSDDFRIQKKFKLLPLPPPKGDKDQWTPLGVSSRTPIREFHSIPSARGQGRVSFIVYDKPHLLWQDKIGEFGRCKYRTIQI